MFRYIVGMALDRKSIYDSLVDCGDQISKHIVKILMYPHATTIRHWEAEIYSFLHIVKRLKGSKKRPSSKFIAEALSTSNDILSEIVKVVADEEWQFEPVSIDLKRVESVVIEYQKWIAEQLSSKGYVTSSEVVSKLEELREVS